MIIIFLYDYYLVLFFFLKIKTKKNRVIKNLRETKRLEDEHNMMVIMINWCSYNVKFFFFILSYGFYYFIKNLIYEGCHRKLCILELVCFRYNLITVLNEIQIIIKQVSFLFRSTIYRFYRRWIRTGTFPKNIILVKIIIKSTIIPINRGKIISSR